MSSLLLMDKSSWRQNSSTRVSAPQLTSVYLCPVSDQLLRSRVVAGSLKLELAQYREVAAFAQFGSDLDASTQHLLNRGEKLTELLKQKQYVPIPVEEQVCILFAGVRGHLDKMMTSEIGKFEKLFIDHLKSKHAHIIEGVKTEKQLSDKAIAELRQIIEDFIPTAGFIMKS